MKDIFIVVFATLSVCFAASYISVLRQSIKLKRDVSKLFIEKTLLQEYVDITKSTKIKEDSDVFHNHCLPGNCPSDFTIFCILNKYRKLISCIPGVSTHVEIEWLTKFVDWDKEFENSFI